MYYITIVGDSSTEYFSEAFTELSEAIEYYQGTREEGVPSSAIRVELDNTSMSKLFEAEYQNYGSAFLVQLGNGNK